MQYMGVLKQLNIKKFNVHVSTASFYGKKKGGKTGFPSRRNALILILGLLWVTFMRTYERQSCLEIIFGLV